MIQLDWLPNVAFSWWRLYGTIGLNPRHWGWGKCYCSPGRSFRVGPIEVGYHRGRRPNPEPDPLTPSELDKMFEREPVWDQDTI